MNQNLIYYPCFSLLILSALVLLRMFILRLKAVKDGRVDVKHFKTYSYAENNLPIEMLQASRNFTNLFEVPTLFYMISLFALVTQSVDRNLLILAWGYVLARYIHSFVHLTSNKIMPRMLSYMVSWLFLIAMAVIVALRVS